MPNFVEAFHRGRFDTLAAPRIGCVRTDRAALACPAATALPGRSAAVLQIRIPRIRSRARTSQRLQDEPDAAGLTRTLERSKLASSSDRCSEEVVMALMASRPGRPPNGTTRNLYTPFMRGRFPSSGNQCAHGQLLQPAAISPIFIGDAAPFAISRSGGRCVVRYQRGWRVPR